MASACTALSLTHSEALRSALQLARAYFGDKFESLCGPYREAIKVTMRVVGSSPQLALSRILADCRSDLTDVDEIMFAAVAAEMALEGQNG